LFAGNRRRALDSLARGVFIGGFMKRIMMLLVAALCVGAGPTTKPTATTRPANKPAAPQRVRDGMMEGKIRFLVPASWELIERADNGIGVRYKLPDEKGTVGMMVTVQKQAMPNDHAGLREQMGQALLKSVKKNLEERKLEVVDPPKLERDEAFMAKVRYRVREEGEVVDGMHAYRAVGIYLMNIASSAVTADKEEAKAMHETASLMLMSVTTGPADAKIMRPVK
jgi:hypothetical protein